MKQKDNPQLWAENRAFFQASTIKGARYLDDAGKILNDYKNDYYDSTVGLEGLHLAKPKKDGFPDEIVVDMNRIWMACYGDGCISKIRASAETITKSISKHIGVDSYSRLGFRVYYFKSVSNVRRYVQGLYSQIAAQPLQTMVPADRMSEMIWRTKFSDGNFSVWLGVQAISIGRPPEKQSDFASDGAIIDIDVSEDQDSSTRRISSSHLAPFVRESSDRLVANAHEIFAFLKGVDENAARG